jgi:ABC-type transport system involved in cytochrome c biogenesis permease subunit
MRYARVTIFAHTVLAAVLMAIPALAQEESPVQAFEAASGAPKENLPAWPFLYGAYFCIWGLLFAYIIFTWYRNVQLSGRISELDARLDRLDGELERLEGGGQ